MGGNNANPLSKPYTGDANTTTHTTATRATINLAISTNKEISR